MATTTLQMVSNKEIGLLQKTPSTIVKLQKPHGESYSTRLFGSINYFLCGTPSPEAADSALAASLIGFDSVAAPALPSGFFKLVIPAQAAVIAKALEAFDLQKLRKDVETADPAKLKKAKIEDLELLLANDSPAATLFIDVKGLTTFYKDAAAKHLGVAIYTR
ncbi:MAG: hypothetical protein H6Q90_2697 [Deltaproteobacteria bacterium]|nr:hypothetical protein [Deltaproteobacteria bacterium]